jgi:serine/threonine protein kinase
MKEYHDIFISVLLHHPPLNIPLRRSTSLLAMALYKCWLFVQIQKKEHTTLPLQIDDLKEEVRQDQSKKKGKEEEYVLIVVSCLHLAGILNETNCNERMCKKWWSVVDVTFIHWSTITSMMLQHCYSSTILDNLTTSKWISILLDLNLPFEIQPLHPTIILTHHEFMAIQYQENLGQGSFGKVVSVQIGDPKSLHTTVALKISKHLHVSLKELYMWNWLLSPEKQQDDLDDDRRKKNIIPLKSVYFSSSLKRTFLMMEQAYSTLSHWLNEQKNCLQESIQQHIMISLVDALHYVHHKGVVHRDLTLNNILVFLMEGNENLIQVKISDWGCGRINLCEGPMSTELCALHFRSPEYLLGVCDSWIIAQQSDIFSLGIIFYTLYHGSPLVTENNREDQWNKYCDIYGWPNVTIIIESIEKLFTSFILGYNHHMPSSTQYESTLWKSYLYVHYKNNNKYMQEVDSDKYMQEDFDDDHEEEEEDTLFLWIMDEMERFRTISIRRKETMEKWWVKLLFRMIDMEPLLRPTIDEVYEEFYRNQLKR